MEKGIIEVNAMDVFGGQKAQNKEQGEINRGLNIKIKESVLGHDLKWINVDFVDLFPFIHVN